MADKKLNPTLKTVTDYAVLFSMAVLMALNYQIFILHNAFAPSGINGLATMIQYLFNFSVGYFSLIMNIPLAIFCWLFVNKQFAVRTMLFTVVFSVALLILQTRVDLSRFIYHTDDGRSTLLAPVVSGTINGFISLHIESSQQKLPKTTLLNTILNVVIYAMGVLVVLQYYGISIAPILTAMGVGGMAVALALQETLANIFSGLHLILSKQLRLDDYIKLSTGEEGRVTDITWRFTTIVPAGGGNMIVIPNQKIASSNITNYSMPRKDIVISIPVGVAYDSDLDKVERVTLDVAKEVMAQIDKDVKMEPAVRFHTFGESSIDFNVVLHSSYFEHQFLLKHEFIKALTRRYREEGIEIPYPTRTVLQPEEPATR